MYKKFCILKPIMPHIFFLTLKLDSAHYTIKKLVLQIAARISCDTLFPYRVFYMFSQKNKHLISKHVVKIKCLLPTYVIRMSVNPTLLVDENQQAQLTALKFPGI